MKNRGRVKRNNRNERERIHVILFKLVELVLLLQEGLVCRFWYGIPNVFLEIKGKNTPPENVNSTILERNLNMFDNHQIRQFGKDTNISGERKLEKDLDNIE